MPELYRAQKELRRGLYFTPPLCCRCPAVPVRSMIYVVLQFACAAGLVLSVNPKSVGLPAIIATSAGLMPGVWAIVTIRFRHLSVLPELKSEATLITHGPYRWIRHPMYSGLILFCGGFVLTPFEWWKLTVWFFLIVDLDLKARYEESLLTKQFPEYLNYRTSTRRFIPFLY